MKFKLSVDTLAVAVVGVAFVVLVAETAVRRVLGTINFVIGVFNLSAFPHTSFCFSKVTESSGGLIPIPSGPFLFFSISLLSSESSSASFLL